MAKINVKLRRKHTELPIDKPSVITGHSIKFQPLSGNKSVLKLEIPLDAKVHNQNDDVTRFRSTTDDPLTVSDFEIFLEPLIMPKVDATGTTPVEGTSKTLFTIRFVADTKKPKDDGF